MSLVMVGVAAPPEGHPLTQGFETVDAELTIAGPPFGGVAHVDFYLFGKYSMPAGP